MKKDDFKFLFKDFPFEEAQRYFGEKLPITKERFRKLAEKYRRGAFTVAGYTQAEVLNQFYTALQKALEEGTTKEQFRESMEEFLSHRGYKGISAYQADNIFRTNIQSAYQAGHYASMTEPETARLRPYWMYDAVGDSRTRPAHMAMNGKVFAADSPVWDTWYPPNGYRCRCTVVTLSERQVKARGLAVETEAPSSVRIGGKTVPAAPDPSFQHNAAKEEFRPDMSQFPEAIKKAYYADRAKRSQGAEK